MDFFPSPRQSCSFMWFRLQNHAFPVSCPLIVPICSAILDHLPFLGSPISFTPGKRWWPDLPFPFCQDTASSSTQVLNFKGGILSVHSYWAIGQSQYGKSFLVRKTMIQGSKLILAEVCWQCTKCLLVWSLPEGQASCRTPSSQLQAFWNLYAY